MSAGRTAADPLDRYDTPAHVTRAFLRAWRPDTGFRGILEPAAGHMLTKDEIAEATGLDERTVRARLSDLKKRGDVVQVTRGGQTAALWGLATDREEEGA